MGSSTNFIASYVFEGSIAVLVELSTSHATPIQSPKFSSLAGDIAKHIAAMEPLTIDQLLEQPAVMDVTRTIHQLLEGSGVPDANIVRFVRWVAGGGPSESPDLPPSSPAAVGVA